MLKQLWESVQLDEAVEAEHRLLSERVQQADACLQYMAEEVAMTGMEDFDTATKMMNAAKKALGIVGSMPPGEFRAKHSKAIMVNMNKIRGLVTRAIKSLTAQEAGTASIEDEEFNVDSFVADNFGDDFDDYSEDPDVARAAGVQASRDYDIDDSAFSPEDDLAAMADEMGFDDEEEEYGMDDGAAGGCGGGCNCNCGCSQ